LGRIDQPVLIVSGSNDMMLQRVFHVQAFEKCAADPLSRRWPWSDVSMSKALRRPRRALLGGITPFEGALPKLDPGIAAALWSGDHERVKDYEENGPRPSI
jgi:hypothetical protein